MPLDPSAYTSAATHLAEATLFRSDWVLLDALATVPPGHASSRTVHGVPYLIWNHPEGVKAFVNICPHRGGPLMQDGHTEPCPKLRCRYHGWQFDSDGGLTRAPGFDGETGQQALRPVQVRVWRGLVFASLDNTTPLDSRLAALDSAPDWSAWTVARTAEHELACNWKTYVENYLEGYHIPYLHPALTAEVVMRSYRVEARDGVALHHVKSREGAVNSGFWAWIWPNAALNVYDRALCVERILPLGPQRCAIAYTYLFHPELSEAEQDERIGGSAQTTAEDIWMCETVQRNLDTGLFTPGPLSPKHENGLSHFHDLWNASRT